MTTHDAITTLRGVGPKKAKALEKLKIRTLEDFLCFYPREYEDRREVRSIETLTDGETALIRGQIQLIVKNGYAYGKKRTIKLLVSDQTSSIELIFFHSSYLEKSLNKDVLYEFYGKVTSKAGRLQMVHPDFHRFQENGESGILPIYPLTQGLSQSDLRRWQREACHLIPNLTDYLPSEIQKRNRVCSLSYAISNIHFPGDPQKVKEAKFRLIFDELFLLQLGLLKVKEGLKQNSKGIAFGNKFPVSDFTNSFPYELTNAQKKVLAEIEQDMETTAVMNRLVQGDVGSGKTAVAAAAIYKAVRSGYQAVLMAPTELLARQHYATFLELCKPFSIEVSLLTGSMPQKERKEVLASLSDGRTQVCIGTHAVIQPEVEFQKLGLVITDEQHRFGVNQRSILTRKGENPDTLVMTATPIPRTLAVILYGDLSLSAIDEMPPGRKPVITKAVPLENREWAYSFLRKEIQTGRQAYIVAPLIEDSDQLDAKSATQLYEEVSEQFKGHSIALLHGGMKQSEKDRIMEEFYANRIAILVSTVVIEVGINVPNATIMLIENADRFGLATLHQLRGRVGRGEFQSTCILISEGKTELAKERAKILSETNDGFLIAEKDLELRGPGEFFGTKQHGIPELRLADLAKHIRILELVRKEASDILKKDPGLTQTENRALAIKLSNYFHQNETIQI